jgi:hypothetical protein
VAGLPNALIYGFIAGAVIILLLCGGAGFYFLLLKGGGTGSGAGNQAAKAVDPQDGLKTADTFARRLASEDYGEALKHWSASGLRRRYSTADDIKDYVEKEGKGIIGATAHQFKSIMTTPNSVRFIGQSAGPNGVAKYELLMVDEGDGVKVGELVFKN